MMYAAAAAIKHVGSQVKTNNTNTETDGSEHPQSESEGASKTENTLLEKRQITWVIWVP